MHKIFLALELFFLFANSPFLFPQENLTGEIGDQLGDVIDDLGEEETSRMEEFYEEFSDLSSRKQNINLVPDEFIEKLPFLTPYQLHSFLEYRKKYGRIYSANELWLISGFHEEIIQKFMILFEFEHSTSPEIPNKGRSWVNPRHFLLLRVKTEAPGRAGFLQDMDSSLQFQGAPWYRLLKYELDQKRYLKLGFTLESDAGEAIRFDSITRGFDFQSAYIELRTKKLVDKVLLGDFRIHSGEGLIYSSRRGGKSSLESFRQRIPELKKYSSTSESGFYRGMAVQASRGKFRITSFYSVNCLSAKVYNLADSLSFYRSPDQSGLHRNLVENLDRGNIKSREAGLSIARSTDKLLAGYNFKFASWSPSFGWYELGDRWSPQIIASKQIWQSLYYNFQGSKFLLSAEYSADGALNHALLQKASLYLHPLASLNFAYRNYSPAYLCPGAGSFSESTKPANEKGFFSGLVSYPFSFLKLTCYIDLYRLPRISDDASFPVRGNDFMIDTEWFFSRNLELRMYFKTEIKESKIPVKSTSVPPMMPLRSNRFYLKIGTQINPTLQARTRIEYKTAGRRDGKLATGLLIYQEFNKTFAAEKLKFNIRYTLFDVPGWDARIYAWEHDLLYSFSSPAWYKTGYNAFLNLRWKVTPWCSLGLKSSVTGYTSPRESGTGADYRISSRFFEVKGQVVVRMSELGLKGFGE